MQINLAGYVPILTLDDFGYSSSVIFFRGCDLNCWFCHNKKYQTGEDYIDIKYVEEFLLRDSMLTSSVTLFGGEPLLQLDVVKQLIKDIHLMGKQVCLYTSGNHPDEMKAAFKNCYIRARVKFGGAPNAAPFPSVVVVFKPQTKDWKITSMRKEHV